MLAEQINFLKKKTKKTLNSLLFAKKQKQTRLFWIPWTCDRTSVEFYINAPSCLATADSLQLD